MRTLFVGVSHNKAVDMDKWIFIRFYVQLVINQHIQKLNCVYRKIHVNMVRFLKLLGKLIVLLVYFAHSLAGTHVPANYSLLHFV